MLLMQRTHLGRPSPVLANPSRPFLVCLQTKCDWERQQIISREDVNLRICSNDLGLGFGGGVRTSPV
jgi:hypothetical protein